MGRSQPAPGRLDRHGLPPAAAQLPRPGFREGLLDPIRAVEKFDYRRGYKFFDLRDLVDPPGGDPRGRRQVPFDPHPRPHGREAERVHFVERQLVQGLPAGEPEPQEIAAELGWTVSEVRDVWRVSQTPVRLRSRLARRGDGTG